MGEGGFFDGAEGTDFVAAVEGRVVLVDIYACLHSSLMGCTVPWTYHSEYTCYDQDPIVAAQCKDNSAGVHA